MSITLSNVLPHYYQDQTNKPAANIYILTDGVWSEGLYCLLTIQDHITGLVKHLSTNSRLKHVGIEFIQLGDDEVGKERLEFLDNDGLQHYDVPGDIVDTEPSTGNVFKMLLTSYDRA